MNLAEERWETIKDFPNYLISSESRVMNKTTLKFVAIVQNKRHKHRAIRLWNNGKTRMLKVYRLKAIAFIENPENKPQVNHKYGDRMDEDLNVLEWSTAKENMKHSFRTGLCKGFFKPGLESDLIKLSSEDITLLRRWKKSGFYERVKMHKVFNVSSEYANKVALGRNGNYV